MRDPVMQYPIDNTPEGTRIFSMTGVHYRLAFVVESDKKNPWDAKEKNGTIQNEKRGKTRSLIRLIRFIEPENLRENDEGDGIVTGIKQNAKEDRSSQ
jgi:hypothetical protein